MLPKIKNTKILELFAYILITTAGCALSASTSFATSAPPPTAPAPPSSVIADSPCDTLYYESLSARAWLEAQREISQNQNIILKPDSVFQYTCFNNMMRELNDASSNMLSGTSSFGGPLSGGSLASSLNNLVNNTLITYLENNYGGSTSSGYNLLSGHTAALGIYHNADTVTGSSPYSCDIMGRVWQAAKCINFITNSESDGFYTFGEYAANLDVRHLPNMCTAINGSWAGNLATALTSGPWTNDPVDTYLELTQPDDCAGASCVCNGQPIPTGLTVINETYPGGFSEFICIQPGCRYVPTSATGGECRAD